MVRGSCVIEVTDAVVRFGAGDDEVAALDGVSVSLVPGEVVALVGANGSGKSTLARLLCAMTLADEGSVAVDGIDPATGDRERREVRRRVGFVQQHPSDQLVSTLVADEVAFGPRNLGLAPDEVSRRVARALDVVGLSHTGAHDTQALSGGQQQLLAIAGILAMEPAYIVLDEATSMLDSCARPGMRALVDHLAHDEGLGVIQVTHDPLEILVSDRVIVLDAGRVVFSGSPASFIGGHGALWDATVVEDPCARAVRACIAAGLPEDVGVAPSDAVSWLLAAIGQARVPTASLESVLRALMPRGWGQGERLERADERLVLSRIDFAYGRDACVLRDVSLGVRGGEVVLLAGRSGSGKSTLACVAAGLYGARSGTVTLDGAPLRPGAVGIAFQRPEDQLFCESVRDEIAFAPRNLGASETQVSASVRMAAELVGLEDDLLDRYPFDLSGGQARRVAIASVLSLASGAYLFDEPTAGLDADGRRSLHRVVRACAERGCAVVVISHDLEEWAAEVDRVVLMAAGAVVWEGTPADLSADADAFASAGMRPPLSFELAHRIRAALGEVRA